jgi:hypothetical protein
MFPAPLSTASEPNLSRSPFLFFPSRYDFAALHVMSESIAPLPEVPSVPSKKPRRILRSVRLLFLLTLLFAAAQTEPHVYQFTLRSIAEIEAWRGGYSIRMGEIRSTLFEPLEIGGISIERTAPNGTRLQVQIEHARAEFAFSTLLLGSFDRWISRLTLAGLQCHVFLPKTPEPVTGHPAGKRPAAWIPLPETVELHKAGFVIENGPNAVELEGGHATVSRLEPGRILAARISVRQPWLERSFRGVSGSTALQNSKLLLGGVRLEPEIELKSFSVDLVNLAGVEPALEAELEAFGGSLRTQARILNDADTLLLDGSGTFSRIDFAKFATFFKLSDAAGGIVREGKFTFRGAPRQLDRATASLLLEATNFQWESRQWDSLVLGAALMDRSLKVSKLDLRQGKNRLNLSGEMTLPTRGVPWWQNEFLCDLSADVEDLTALSALLLPEFKYAAGRLKLDGSIRGRNRNFSGQIIVSGSSIKWRNAPVENLHAAVKLSGNELQVLNLELFNGADYLRGHGVASILGPASYWGEFRASIEELSLYTPLLQPILPAPVSGGAVVEWNGEGSDKGSTGKFLARLNRIQTAGKPALGGSHAVNLLAEGAYSQTGAQLARFEVWDGTSRLTADVALGNHALSLKSLRFLQSGKPALEGAAVLPLDIWKSWPKTSFLDLLNPETVSDINLTADHLDLKAVSLLTGERVPLEGILSGQIKASGPIHALATTGSITLAEATLPVPTTARSASKINARIQAENSLVRLESFSATDSSGPFTLSGTIQVGDLLAPKCQLKAELPNCQLQLPGGLSTRSSLQLALDGAVPKLKLSGSGTFSGFSFQHSPEIGFLWAGPAPGTRPPALPPFFGKPPVAWQGCELDVRLTQTSPAGTPSDTALVLSGTLSAPRLEGTVHLGAFAATTQGRPIQVQEASLLFHANTPQDPALTLHISGQTSELSFQTGTTGPLSKPVHQFLVPPVSSQNEPGAAQAAAAEQEAAIRKFLTEPPQGTAPRKNPPAPAAKPGPSAAPKKN